MTQIEVVEYDPHWPVQFQEEAKVIQAALGANCLAVHHVGSTSVEGLCAKPKIDILTVVKDRAGIQSQLEKIGYEWRGEYNIPFHMGYRKRPPALNVNLHVYEEGDPQIELNLLFRDKLRSDPKIKEEYAQLKKEILLDPNAHIKDKNRFTGYNLSKDRLIKRVLKEAGFNRICLHFCMHHNEWRFAKKMVRGYLQECGEKAFKDIALSEESKDRHFVLYFGIQPVGYAHFAFLNPKEAELLFLRIDSPFRNQGFGERLLRLSEKWFHMQGVLSISAANTLPIESFLQKKGFQLEEKGMLKKVMH